MANLYVVSVLAIHEEGEEVAYYHLPGLFGAENEQDLLQDVRETIKARFPERVNDELDITVMKVDFNDSAILGAFIDNLWDKFLKMHPKAGTLLN